MTDKRSGKYDCEYCGRRHSNGWYCKTHVEWLRAGLERIAVMGAPGASHIARTILQNKP